jgi:hypothetical protein
LQSPAEEIEKHKIERTEAINVFAAYYGWWILGFVGFWILISVLIHVSAQITTDNLMRDATKQADQMMRDIERRYPNR